jgi:predicted nucleotidyltransferase
MMAIIVKEVDPKQVVLFGSQARGAARPDSDLDFLIVQDHECDESIHTGKDMQVSDRMLNLLKEHTEGLLEPENIRHIRKKLRLS